MIREISHKIVNYISGDNYSNEDKEVMEYVLNTIIFESSKLIGTLIIFSFIGFLKESLIIIVVMAIIKPYIGGYHEKSQFKCFIATMLLTAGILFMSMHTVFTFLSNCLIILFCIFCMSQQVPVINPDMPITRPHLIQKNRYKGMLNVIFCGLASIILYKYTSYYSIITWEILFLTMLLFNKK